MPKHPNSDRDAILRASAPKLLKALKDLLDIVNEELDEEDSKVWDRAFDAIREAEGRS